MNSSSVPFLRNLCDESKVGLAESSNVRKYGSQVSVSHANPRGEGGAVLVYGYGWYPAASCITSFVRIIGTISCERWENGPIRTRHPVEITAQHGTAHDELVRAPRVVSPEVPIRHPGTRKVG